MLSVSSKTIASRSAPVRPLSRIRSRTEPEAPFILRIRRAERLPLYVRDELPRRVSADSTAKASPTTATEALPYVRRGLRAVVTFVVRSRRPR